MTLAKIKIKPKSLNNAIAVLDADFRQMYSSEWFSKFLSYQKTRSKCGIFGNCFMLFLGPLLCSFSIVILPVDDISKGLTGRNWFQIVSIGIGCLIGSLMVLMRYKTVVQDSRHRCLDIPPTCLCRIDNCRAGLCLSMPLCLDRLILLWFTSHDFHLVLSRKK